MSSDGQEATRPDGQGKCPECGGSGTWPGSLGEPRRPWHERHCSRNVIDDIAAEVLAENEQPSKDMVIWWNLLRPDRLAIADALDKWSKDYDQLEVREGARALREAARWVRATAGEVG